MGSLGIVPNLGQIYNPDSFTGDGSEVDFTLTHLVTSDQSIIWVEGGVVQKPGIDFNISGLTLTRTTAPANLVACFAMYLGVSLDIGVPSDGTVTLAKMAVNSVDSDQYVDGSIDAVHMSANSIDSDSYVDGSIDNAHLADNAVGLAEMAGNTDGVIITFDASGDPVAVGPGSDGEVLTSTGAGSPPAFEAVPAGGFTPGSRVWRTGHASIANATFTKVAYNDESSSTSINWDTDGDFDTTNNRFVVGAGDGGIYLATASIYWQNPSDGSVVRCNIRQNGLSNTQTYHIPGAATTMTTTCTALFKLDATDYLEVWTYQNTGGSEQIMGDERATFFCVQRIA